MNKQLPAFLAALLVTGLIAMTMVVVSANAYINTNGTRASSGPSIAQAANAGQAQIDQLQSRINEYQQREVQYQQMLQQDQQQLQQVGQLLSALQQNGLIQVQPNGSIAITGFRGGGGDD